MTVKQSFSIFLCACLLFLNSCGGKTFTPKQLEICQAKNKELAKDYDSECNLYYGKEPDLILKDKSRTIRLLLTPILLPFGVFFISSVSLKSNLQSECAARGFSSSYIKQIGDTYYGWCIGSGFDLQSNTKSIK